MLRFIVRRLLQLIRVLFGLSLLLFFWLRPARRARGRAPRRAGHPGDARRDPAHLGLDQPVFVQYVNFLRRMIRLDFGTSTGTSGPSPRSSSPGSPPRSS